LASSSAWSRKASSAPPTTSASAKFWRETSSRLTLRPFLSLSAPQGRRGKVRRGGAASRYVNILRETRASRMRLRFPHLTYPLRPQGRRGIRLSYVAALALSLIALPAFAEPALWVAKQGGATVYLFGTVHALKPELKWETPKIARAFAESQELWLEADDADAKTMQPIVAQLGIDRAHPLSSKLA